MKWVGKSSLNPEFRMICIMTCPLKEKPVKRTWKNWLTMHSFVESKVEEGNDNLSLVDYLSEVSLLSDVDEEKDGADNSIKLMTIHSAKGLEFHTVFIVGLEEDLFPSAMSKSTPREIEEERRLFYVAITRAEKNCFIS